ncbi:receptor-type tyrosine-protein phosphatase U-like, partial [Mercenaria mercenaria]|uniref:receptor-type tyrosine-protein phosphatase U-like n=1 Tax=Mercenaria mercenaria TaxID=6596 RepID=UPI00234F4117
MFWKMIWYERSDVIVMLTNLREPSGMKCEKYWPEGGAVIWYGDVCVSCQAIECFAEYTIRTFTLSKEEECRSLTHLHYTAWPDKTVPEDVTSLIEFRQRMKATPTTSEGPVVVHCSAGIGRTGTLIALDRLIEEGQDKGSLNVFECVDNMREQRVKMVQTFEQYMYIYKALVNALAFDCETVPVETFNEYVDATNNNMYSMMFQQLRQSVETDSKADVEARLKNEKLTSKNRRGADIPGSRFRAMLYPNRADEGSEYINAVYINSFVKKDYFIAAQSPLPCTVADFITLVYQEDCSCIATMEDLRDPGMTVGQYLPDDKKTLTVANFKVSSSRLETKHSYVVRKMMIKYTGKWAFDVMTLIRRRFNVAFWLK